MKRALADVLWEAANVHLSPDSPPQRGDHRTEFSCIAAKIAEVGNANETGFAYDWLVDMGSTVHGFMVHPESARQGVRYMQLLLAACVAEDEGIMVEVSA